MATGQGIAPGSDGANLARRLYRRSPARWLRISALAHRGIRPTDVFVASYPRSGSVWLRFLIMEMTVGNANFVDLPRSLPELGGQLGTPDVVPGGGRVIKTHEPYSPRYRRAIHLVRDPRDVTISYFRFMQRLGKIVVRPTDDEEASFERFIDAFIKGRVDAHGTWQSHLMSWTRAADDGRSDILRIRFEDMLEDPVAAVTMIGGWLGLEIGPDRAREVADACSIERMRASEVARDGQRPTRDEGRLHRPGFRLVNSGEAGGWHTGMSARQAARFAAFNEGLAFMGYPPG